MVRVCTRLRTRTLAVLALLAFGWIGLRGAAASLPTRSAAPHSAAAQQLDRNSSPQTVVVQGFDPGRAAGLHVLDQRAEVVFDDTHGLSR